ncbi:hypothetical protein JW826_06550 [Candidatus Woesearchaeota archaeon]|nr:hypothetical protein [Candidatus Woesearchaeota archaeon]
MFCVKVKKESRRKENTANLYIFNREKIREITHEVGLKPSPKWNRAKVPDWIFENKYQAQVLRGYFDTDDCLVITNNNGTKYPRLKMKIGPSPMQKQFIRILEEMGFNFGIYQIGKGKVRVQMNRKKELRKWIKEVGLSNKKHEMKAMQFIQ